MNEFFYLKLTRLHRIIGVVLFSTLFLSFAYFNRYTDEMSQLVRSKQDATVSETVYKKQKKLIDDVSAIQVQIERIQKSLVGDDSLLTIAHKAQIDDVQFTPIDEQQVSLVMNTNWSHVLSFFHFMMSAQLTWSITSLTLEQKENDQLEIKMELEQSVRPPKTLMPSSHGESPSLEESNPFSSNAKVTASLESIPSSETQWVGVLQIGQQWIAFLKLTNGKIIGLQTGETFGKSSWKIFAIQAKQVILQEGSEKVVKNIS